MMIATVPLALLGGLAWLCGMRTTDKNETRALDRKKAARGPEPFENKNQYSGFGHIPKPDDKGDPSGPAINSHSFNRKK